MSRVAKISAFAIGVLVLPWHAVRADVVSDWNDRAIAIVVAKPVPSTPAARQVAMLNIAMFEALNAIERRYTPYNLTLPPSPDAAKDAAAAAAAHAVLVGFHPDQRAALDAALTSALAQVPDGAAKTASVVLGAKAAAEIMALRSADGAAAPESYRPHTTPGVYVPTTIPVASTWGAVTPWVMSKGSQFRPAPPPALTSETWIKDLNEIKALGSRTSTVRTPEQTTIGRFWLFTGPATVMPIVRQLAAARKLDAVDSARVYALVAMAFADAHIAVFDAKYHYNLWRPITAIRYAEVTGVAGERAPAWLALGETPMHPEYPCAHCITAAAGGAVLKAIFGSGEVPEFTLTSPTAPGVTRKWRRIEDYVDEVSLARIYAGFHYRFSTQAGNEMGRQIGELAASTLLRPAR